MTASTGAVVIADADERCRALASKALRRAGYETVEVGTGDDALAAVRADGVSLLLLEVDLPDMTGYEVCRELREDGGHELPIFFISGTRTESLYRVAGLLLGADDFIVKPFDPNELVARVRRFVTRRASPPPAAAASEAAPRLTPREEEILGFLAEGRGQSKIAAQLSISPKTVATHIQHLLEKFSAHSRAELVARAYVLGLARREGTHTNTAEELREKVPA
jgi:DNA-binding NarL/FixJ family response regulator